MMRSCLGSAVRMSGGGNGMCRKKPILLRDAALAQRLGERHQMIVVHPDRLVMAAGNSCNWSANMLVDAQIARQVAAGEFRQIEPVMQDRPQHPVGEAVVIFLIIRLDRSVMT